MKGLTRGTALLALAAGLALAANPPARAQNFGLGLTTQDNNKPITIEADQGIEWQQNNRVYIARGHARATRGQATVFGDVLMAYYRPISHPGAGASAPPPVKNTSGASSDPIGGNSTEIYRLEATGNVRIATETQTVYGDHAVYDVDRTLLVVTGKHLRLETPRDTLTARDSLEWYDDKQLAVARGDAVAIRDGKHLKGDVLTATVTRLPNESSHISRVDAQGNVLVSSQDQIARGDAGVYNVDTGIATLTGRVTLTRGDNELRGQYAVVDLNNNVSRLLSAPPSAQLTQGKPARVQGLLIPRAKPAAPAQ
ncbi:MAG TPA: LptA/OstA family protein [Stellaceae bacterium]